MPLKKLLHSMRHFPSLSYSRSCLTLLVCSQEHHTRCLIHSQVVLLCGRSPASRAIGLYFCPPGPGGSGPKAAVPLSPAHKTPVVQFLAVWFGKVTELACASFLHLHICCQGSMTPGPHGCPQRWDFSGSLLSFKYASMDLERSWLSFKSLFQLFLVLCW